MKTGDQAAKRVGNDNGTPVFNRFIDDEVVTKRVSGGEHPMFGVNYNLY